MKFTIDMKSCIIPALSWYSWACRVHASYSELPIYHNCGPWSL